MDRLGLDSGRQTKSAPTSRTSPILSSRATAPADPTASYATQSGGGATLQPHGGYGVAVEVRGAAGDPSTGDLAGGAD